YRRGASGRSRPAVRAAGGAGDGDGGAVPDFARAVAGHFHPVPAAVLRGRRRGRLPFRPRAAPARCVAFLPPRNTRRLGLMRSAISALAALALAGCREKAAAQPAPAPAPAPPPQTTPLRSDLTCAAPPDAPGAREKLRAAKGEVRIGAIAGLNDADEDNAAVIRRLVAELKRRGAEVLVAAGDLGA